MIDKITTVLSLIYSNTSIIIVSGPVRWKKTKSKKNGQTTSASEKFRSIHRYGFPCNLLILNKNHIINSIVFKWLWRISLDCDVETHNCPLILVSCKLLKFIKYYVFVKVFNYSVLFLPLFISKIFYWDFVHFIYDKKIFFNDSYYTCK